MGYLIGAVVVIIFIIWFVFGTDDGEPSVWSLFKEQRAINKRIKLQETELAQLRKEADQRKEATNEQ